MRLLGLLLVCVVSGGALGSVHIFTKTEGQDLSVGCFFNSSGSRKLFMRKEGGGGGGAGVLLGTSGGGAGVLLETSGGGAGVLLETSGLTAESGRFSINYDSDIELFYVKVERLQPADSGRYSCGLGPAAAPESLREFEVRVTDVMCDETSAPGSELGDHREASGQSFRVRCSFPSAGLFPLFLCRDSCRRQDVLIQTSEGSAQSGRYRIDYDRNGVFYASIAGLTESDAGRYRCGVDRTSAPNPCLSFRLNVTDAHSDPHSAARLSETQSQKTGLLFPLIGCLLVMLLLLAASLLLYRKRRRSSDDVNAAEFNCESLECATFDPAAV